MKVIQTKRTNCWKAASKWTSSIASTTKPHTLNSVSWVHSVRMSISSTSACNYHIYVYSNSRFDDCFATRKIIFCLLKLNELASTWKIALLKKNISKWQCLTPRWKCCHKMARIIACTVTTQSVTKERLRLSKCLQKVSIIKRSFENVAETKTEKNWYTAYNVILNG